MSKVEIRKGGQLIIDFDFKSTTEARKFMERVQKTSVPRVTVLLRTETNVLVETYEAGKFVGQQQ